MTPPGNGGRRAPHLQLVPNGGSPTPDADAPPTSILPTSSSNPPAGSDRSSLLPARTDTTQFRALLAGEVSSLNHFQHLTNFLSELANPTASGGFDVQFRILKNTFRLTQGNPGDPIRVSVGEETPASAGRPAAFEERYWIQYGADGEITSKMHSTAHGTPERGPEYTFHGQLTTFLQERAERLMVGEDLFTRIDTALRGLRGRSVTQSQSVWYDNFVVHGGKVYSFRRLDLMGLNEIIASPQHNQIAVFEEADGNQVKIATLSENGEVEFAAGRSSRDPLSHDQIQLLGKLGTQLDEAHSDPAGYQRRLRGALSKLPNFQSLNPTIEAALPLSRTITMGSGHHGYLAEYRSGWDLLGNLFRSQRWQNPQDPTQVRTLRAPWRLQRAMGFEMLRWAGNSVSYTLFENIKSPRNATDRLRLLLHPEGGGQLTVYRNNSLYDIMIAGRNGTVWRADQVIRQLQRDGATFPNRLEALRAAVATHNPDSNLPIAIRVQEAPTLDLSRFHLNGAGESTPIRSAQEAWAAISKQIPEGIEPRVEFHLNGNVLSPLVGNSNEPNRILVDFRESQPSLTLDISHQMIQMGDSEVPRVQISMVRGEDVYARVFENGILRPDLMPDLLHARVTQARQGTVRRNFLTLLGQTRIRAWAHSFPSLMTYGSSYILAQPFILGAERLIYNDTERRLIGSPNLFNNLRWENLNNNILKPFLAMAAPSSAASMFTDGLFNAVPGIGRSIGTWWNTEATFTQALRMYSPSFYNPSPIVRPIGPSFFLRGFMQRAVPLFVGMTAMDRYQHGQWFSPRFWTNMRDVAAVSAGSAGLLRLAYASESVSRTLVRGGLLTDAAAGAGEARFGLTMRGGIALATLEMIALGVINAYERRSLLNETGTALRTSLGEAIDRRNELITRLESGEEVAPRHLVTADTEVHNAQAAYRRFLQLTDHSTGSGNYSAISSANDFQDEQERYEAALVLANSTPGDPLARGRAESDHFSRLQQLRGRYESMEGDLEVLYERYGASGSSFGDRDSLRAFLARASAAGSADAAPAAEAVHSPIAVDSEEGRMILEQLRWKATQDPGSVLWSREQRSAYILREFRGYRVTEADGTRRPWNQADTLAFLDSVDQANIQRIHNLETPLTTPQASDRFDTTRLQELLTAERGIREREAVQHRHVGTHTAVLADNASDLDGQMADYYRSSNERVATALSRFMGDNTLAMADSADAGVAAR